jgi:hypothetical protein
VFNKNNNKCIENKKKRKKLNKNKNKNKTSILQLYKLKVHKVNNLKRKKKNNYKA